MAVLPSTREPPGSVRRNSAYGAEARTSSAPSSRRVQSSDPLAPHGYQTLGPIAAGAFSQIARARHAGSRCEVAVKSFNKVKCAKEPHLGSAMKNELDVLKLLQPAKHRHVANILAVLESKNSIHAVLEYCGGGSLHRQLQTRGHAKGFSERESIVVTAQLCSGLAYMHGLGVAHRDVKPENILFTDGSLSSVKLCDFGFAIRCGERRLRTVCGSPQYMAPELTRASARYAGPERRLDGEAEAFRIHSPGAEEAGPQQESRNPLREVRVVRPTYDKLNVVIIIQINISKVYVLINY